MSLLVGGAGAVVAAGRVAGELVVQPSPPAAGAQTPYHLVVPERPSRRVLLAGLASVIAGQVAACSGRPAAPAPATAAAGASSAAGGAGPSTPAGSPSTSSQAAAPSGTTRVATGPPPGNAATTGPPSTNPPASRAQIVARYGRSAPTAFGLTTPGVVQSLGTGQRVAALTFDACGGPGGTGFDSPLVDLLREHRVPATFFLNARWIAANPGRAAALHADPLFELASHGVRHLPLSVTGRAAYGIAGTADAGEVYDELTGNRALTALGASARLFRSGTAHVDDVSVAIARDLGIRIVNFTVNGDGGATFSAGQVAAALATLGAGGIVISHGNRPGSGTAAGYAAALPRLLAGGWRFVRLSERI